MSPRLHCLSRGVGCPAGAAGLMQIMPGTARSPGFGIKPMDWSKRFDPQENIRFGVDYLEAMLGRYKGDVRRALVAYNAGPGVADKWNGQIGSLPKETQGYVTKIVGSLANQRSERPAQNSTRGCAPQLSSQGGRQGDVRLAQNSMQMNDASPAMPKLRPVSDPDLIRALEGRGQVGQPAGKLRPVSDPDLIRALEGVGRPAPNTAGPSVERPAPEMADGPQPGQAEKPRAGITFGNALDSFTQGMTLGFGDELTAAESAVLGRTPDGGWFDYSKPIGERYNTALAAERGQQEQFAEDHQYVDAGLKIAGGVGSAVAAAPAMPIKAAATLPGRAAQVTAGGAVGGGATGFGEGEGGVGPRLMSAGVNAGIGAVAAPLLGLPAAKLAQVAGKTFGDVIFPVPTRPGGC